MPLIEIVSEPDIATPDEAYEYFTRLKEIILYTGVSDCNMEEGSLRCDANVSVRPRGQKEFGTKAEIKNVNSFRFIREALEYEIDRQIEIIESGGKVAQETRLYNANEGGAPRRGVETKMSGTQPSPIKLPSTAATLDIAVDITVKEVSNKGDIIYEVALGEASGAEEPAGGAPSGAKAKKSALAGVKGMSATGTVSSQGLSKGFDFKAPPGADAQTHLFMDLMKDVFVQLATPLPEEPVGAGAKWEVKVPIQSHGVKVDQTASYELVSIEGDNLKTKSTSTQHAANQKIDNPIMPGLKLDLTKWTGKGTSELGLDAGKIMPSSGTMELHSEIGMGLNMGAQSQGFTMKMDVNLHSRENNPANPVARAKSPCLSSCGGERIKPLLWDTLNCTFLDRLRSAKRPSTPSALR